MKNKRHQRRILRSWISFRAHLRNALNYLVLPLVFFSSAQVALGGGDDLFGTNDECSQWMSTAKYYISMEDRISAESVLAYLKGTKSPCPSTHARDTLVDLLKKKAEDIPYYPKFEYPSTFSIGPYYGFLNFGSAAAKDSGTVTGAYGNWSDYYNTIDLIGDKIHLNLKNNLTAVDQYDFGGYYTRQIINEHWKVKIGTMNYISTDRPNSSGHVYALNIDYLAYPFELGVENYYSNYPLFQTDSLTTYQFTPYVSYSKGNATFKLTGFFIDFVSHHGAPLLVTALGDSKILGSGKVEVDYAFSPFTVSLSGNLGRRIFGVREGGFIVENTIEEHQKIIDGALGVSIGKFFVKADYLYEWVKNVQLNNSYTDSALIFLATYNF